MTISLGDACRPGCLADASDVCQIEELVRLGELTKRAWAKDVQVMVEGPGHMPLDQIEANMKIQQTICRGGAVPWVRRICKATSLKESGLHAERTTSGREAVLYYKMSEYSEYK